MKYKITGEIRQKYIINTKRKITEMKQDLELFKDNSDMINYMMSIKPQLKELENELKTEQRLQIKMK